MPEKYRRIIRPFIAPNRGLQIAGNKYGLQSFSNYLYLVAHGLISHVSYEQLNGYSNNYITSFRCEWSIAQDDNFHLKDFLSL